MFFWVTTVSTGSGAEGPRKGPRKVGAEKGDLADNLITDQGLVNLGDLERLQSLHLEGCPVSNAGVERLRQRLPRTEIVWEEDGK